MEQKVKLLKSKTNQMRRLIIEMLADGAGINAAYLTGMAIVDAVANTQRSCRDEIARARAQAHPGHWSIGKAHRQQGLDFYTDGAYRFLDAGQGGVIGDAQAVGVFQFRAARLEPGFNLGTGAVHQYQPYTKAMQQCNIVHEIGEACIGDRLAAKDKHEGATAVGVNVRRRLAKVLDEVFLPLSNIHGTKS